ncbi:NAD(P)H-hydrate dehydratase [Candidatus Ruminimicrobiellum ovillum]|uniref:NAD(P)H-hydrate dehydratase n=1 Tax=Candidatus Ruminimicrobiellum ovillum TaxID=1947927 RepID=UPI00355A1917
MQIKNIFKRNQNGFKNNFGHVLVIAGSYNMPGAGVLCANSAITSGAGLVTIAFPKSAYPVIAKNIKPEIMLLPLEEKNGTFSKSAQNKILKFIEKRKITSVAIGCGTGKSSSVKNLILSIIKKFDIYVTIDADGLNSLEGKQKNSIIKEFKNSKSKIIVTPHPKEFERISGVKYKEDKNYRKEITKTFAENNDIICLLKGHKTVVSDGKKVYVNTTGNAGMATAGSGDVLTGIISAFACIENKDLLLKVSTAVYVHGLAGDFAAKEKSQVSMTASDIIGNIFKAIKKITK